MVIILCDKIRNKQFSDPYIVKIVKCHILDILLIVGGRQTIRFKKRCRIKVGHLSNVFTKSCLSWFASGLHTQGFYSILSFLALIYWLSLSLCTPGFWAGIYHSSRSAWARVCTWTGTSLHFLSEAEVYTLIICVSSYHMQARSQTHTHTYRDT